MKQTPNTIDVRCIQPQELETLLDVITLFMQSDDFFRWIFPDPVVYLKAFRPFMRGICQQSITCQYAWVAGDFHAVAVMLPPGAESDGHKDAAAWIPDVCPEVLADLSRLGPQIDALRPAGPAVNMALVGADGLQRRDVLRTMMLKVCDQDLHERLGPEFGIYGQVTSPILERTYRCWDAVCLGSAQEGNSPTVKAYYRPPKSRREKPQPEDTDHDG